MDRKRRELERAAAVGDPDAPTRLLIEQLRSGALAVEKLRKRAKGGDEVAIAAYTRACWGVHSYAAYFSPRVAYEPGAPFDGISGEYRWRSQNVNLVLPGDRLIAIRVEAGRLHLLGSLLVEKVPPIEPALRESQRPIVGRSEHAFGVRIAPAALLKAWRYRASRGGERAIKHAAGRVVRTDGMNDVYLLTEDTARRALAVLAAS